MIRLRPINISMLTISCVDWHIGFLVNMKNVPFVEGLNFSKVNSAVSRFNYNEILFP
jgi:hypothetical protein